MLHGWAEKITLFLWKLDQVKEEELEICTYGVEILISSLIGVLLTIGVGIWQRDILAILWFLCGFIPIRSYAGGYHAERHISCILLFASAGLLSIFLTGFFLGNPLWRICSAAVAGMIFFLLAPLDHDNRRLSEEEKSSFRKKSRRIAGVLLLIIWGGSALGPAMVKLSSGVASGMILSSISLLIAVIMEGRKKHETVEIH